MNLDTLISPEEASAQLAQYEAQLAGERTAEDEAIMAGYRAAKRGLPVIQLSRAFDLAGQFPDGRPKLAVVRADAKLCRVDVVRQRNETGRSPQVEYSFSDADYRNENRGALVGRYHVNVTTVDAWATAGQAPGAVRRRRYGDGSIGHGVTVVPSIPPKHRPNQRRLRNCHILWEVERWDPTPPVDPALIRHIRGDLWAVMAVWDLTELERAVLAQRAVGTR